MERTIGVLTDVKDLSEWLDGSRVDQARLVPSSGRLRLELELTRACPELSTTARRGFLTRTKTPWVRCHLAFNQVTEASVQHLTEPRPGETSLLSCEAVAGGYQLVVTAPDGLQLVLKLEQLDGHFVDTGTPIASP